MLDLLRQNFSSVLDAVGSTQPTPGGGSASLMSGMIGLSLVKMAFQVSVSGNDPEHGGVNSELLRYQNVLENLVSADMEIFSEYMRVLKMDKSNEAAKETRSQALFDVTVKSIEVPLSSAEAVLGIMQYALSLEPRIKSSIVSDLFAGVLILESSARAVLLNVDANLQAKRMADVREHFYAQKQRVVDEISLSIDQMNVMISERYKN